MNKGYLHSCLIRHSCYNYWILNEGQKTSSRMNLVLRNKGLAKAVSVSILVTLTLCYIRTSDALINIDRILGCHPREYTFNASKTVEVNGEMLSCWDEVTVYSCWGRCVSFEYADYKIPYKISYHPVCTYTGMKTKKVKLNCHAAFPDPYYEIFDASGCSCKLCDSRNTRCKNLNR
ncbi:thyrostimulin beta-5 subunit-like [Ruditapes philippinarum]|uniref:thyrostimulin beta-5 subunit-like n=1 Tax=Ruditapes philippinarum TaxID=129788 RepID=UPI00295BAE64|nr:thyrostimulin beta-5 subunit-like [Ruditapes philippinarum]